MALVAFLLAVFGAVVGVPGNTLPLKGYKILDAIEAHVNLLILLAKSLSSIPRMTHGLSDKGAGTKLRLPAAVVQAVRHCPSC
jgi:hypothetical protein